MDEADLAPDWAQALLARRAGAAGAATESAVGKAARSLAGAVAERLAGVHPPADSLQADALALLAADLVRRALDGSQAPGGRGGAARFAIESVLFTEGRPAARAGPAGVEPPWQVAGSAFWRQRIGEGLAALQSRAAACAAIVVREDSGLRPPWLQGTGWLAAPDLVVTNRHVLRPPVGVTLAARRVSAPTEGRLRPGLTIFADFARFVPGQPPSAASVRVLEAPYVAADDDPMDIAVLRIEPYHGAERLPLKPAGAPVSPHVYVVGHPGALPIKSLDPRITAVFGDPDGTKRLSPGELIEVDEPQPCIMLHDCSTIGGYSGGPVIDMRDHRVAALHFSGAVANGNRGLIVDCLRRSGAARFLM